MRITNDFIVKLNENEIFVFGSNLNGIHGGGAARLAYEKFGAKWGVGYGLEGQSFAIPTKNKNIETMPVSEIKEFVDKFIIFAKSNSNLIFMVTEIGCGLAGYKPIDIAPLFKEAISIDNVYLPEKFWKILT